jgi:hypothetical protein
MPIMAFALLRVATGDGIKLYHLFDTRHAHRVSLWSLLLPACELSVIVSLELPKS